MLRAEADKDDALLTKSSLDIELVAENQDDINTARMMKYRTVACECLLRENFNDFILNYNIVLFICARLRIETCDHSPIK